MNVGERIKNRRKELGYNADFLAKHLGVSRSTVFRYENGEIEKLPTEVLEKLSIILDTTPGYFMGWEENLSNQLLNNFNQLSEERKIKVVEYTNNLLIDQKNSNNVHSISQNKEAKSDEINIDTIAASSRNPNKKVTKEELDRLNKFLDEVDKESRRKEDKYKK